MEVDEESIAVDLHDDLTRKTKNGKKEVMPPKPFLSAVDKIMEKANLLWEDRLHSLFRVSRTTQMTHDDFINCLVDLQVQLTSEEILACYKYLKLDFHGHIMQEHPSELGGGFSKEHKQQIANYQNQINNQKTERAMFARQ